MKTMTLKTLLLACSIGLTLIACGGKGSASADNSVQTKPSPQRQTNLPPDHPNISEQVGMTGSTPTPAADRLTGEIRETMNAGGYTYINLAGPTGGTWVAVSETKVKVGDKVTIDAQMTLDDFESKSLNRKFEHIVFGSLANPNSPASSASSMGMGTPEPAAKGMGAMHSGLSKVTEKTPINVERAPGGLKVAEVWAQRQPLAGKQVVIRAKVVKFLPNIMGKNWLHVRDGSGSDEKGDNDLTVTVDSSIQAAAGDVIVVTGTVKADTDLGQGYKYPVLIENAKISK